MRSTVSSCTVAPRSAFRWSGRVNTPTSPAGWAATPVVFRTDLAAPVIDLQAESDVTGILNSVVVRQPDSDTFRLWEVAGTAHADVHLLGPTISGMLDCGAPINDGPLHLVAKAALRGLDDWVRTGEPPPEAPRLEVTSDDPPAIRRDADGIALGGIRTPPVDVPVAVLSGIPGPKAASCASCSDRRRRCLPSVSPSSIRRVRTTSSAMRPRRTRRSRRVSCSPRTATHCLAFADPSAIAP